MQWPQHAQLRRGVVMRVGITIGGQHPLPGTEMQLQLAEAMNAE